MPAIDRITFDPEVMGGRPCIRGLRVTVETILGLFVSGRTEEEILKAYPYLEREDLQAADDFWMDEFIKKAARLVLERVEW